MLHGHLLLVAEEIGEQLLGIGESAAAAVALGLYIVAGDLRAAGEDSGEFLEAVRRLLGGREFG